MVNEGTCKVRNEMETKPKSKLNDTKIQNQNEMKKLSLRVSYHFRYLDLSLLNSR
jgi:hypothetical protein